MSSKKKTAVTGPVERPVRPHRTEWRQIADALKLEYGTKHATHYSFERHVYVGRAGALLLKAERQDAAARAVIQAFEQLGRTSDTVGLLQTRANCETAMAALNDALGPNV